MQCIPSKLARVIDVALKLFHAWELGHLGFTTGTDSGDDAFEVAIGRVVDDPSALLILVDLFHGCVELGACFKSVFLPKLLYLAQDLLSIGIPAFPLDRGVEAEHHGVNLKTG